MKLVEDSKKLYAKTLEREEATRLYASTRMLLYSHAHYCGPLHDNHTLLLLVVVNL